MTGRPVPKWYGDRPLRPLWHAVVLCISLLVWSVPGSALAQYRGGREPPEENYLQRTGILYVHGGAFLARPVRDFRHPTGGAASTGIGWKVDIGAWMSPNVTFGFEYGGFDNDRYSAYHPFAGEQFAFISWMGFDNTFWQAVIRYHLRVEKRVIPYLYFGGGRIYSSFLLDSHVYGYTERIEISKMSKKGVSMLSYGLGVDVVLARHVTAGLECCSMEWSTDELIPQARIWGVLRLALNLSWHF